MSVGLLIITHGGIGAQMLETATQMLGTCPLQTASLQVNLRCDPDEILTQAQAQLQRLDQGQGVLVLTDAYGSTPSNIANRLRQNDRVSVVAGVNLPMLIRVLNYPALKLSAMVIKALSGGHDGILLCDKDPQDRP